MKHECGGKEEQSKKLEKDKYSFCSHTAKRPQLKAVVKNWTTGNRNNRTSVPAELIILHGRRRVVAHIITHFSGTNSWCYRFMKKCKRTVKSSKKEDITPVMKTVQCLKKVNVWTVTTVTMSATAVMQISRGSTISRNFTMHRHYVELYMRICP